MADPTTGDLIRSGKITVAEVDAAADAFLMGVTGTRFELAEGYRLNLRDAVAASPYATQTLAKEGAKEPEKRGAVRTAILLATPTAG